MADYMANIVIPLNPAFRGDCLRHKHQERPNDKNKYCNDKEGNQQDLSHPNKFIGIEP